MALRANRGSKSQRSVKEREPSSDDSRFKLRTSVTMMHLPSMNNKGTKTPDTSRSSVRSILKKTKNNSGEKSKKKPKMRTKTCNQDMFDIDNQSSIPLLSAEIRQKCSLYIEQYINLLEIWQLWLYRAEMLNILHGPNRARDLRARSRAQSVSGGSKMLKGLEIRRCCPTCGDSLAPIEKNGIAISWHCVRQSCLLSLVKLSRRQACSICEVKIRGLSIPCLQCGHITCYGCAQAWFCIPEDHHRSSSTTSNSSTIQQSEHPKAILNDHTSCPTGCGCQCPTLYMIEVVPPPDLANGEHTAYAPLSRTESLLSNHSSRASVDMNRTQASGVTRSQRLMSSNGPDKAISALLSIGHRSRSVSQAKNSISKPSASSSSHDQNQQHQREPTSGKDDLVPWAHLHMGTTLGKGVGGGLSRGLNTKGSDSTIRKA